MRQVNIIGAGLAGLSAAICLAEMGVGARLISPQPSERAQSVLAEGGVNGALDLMGEGDTVAEHCADTLRGGCALADPNAVAAMTAAAPEILRRLIRLGVPFQRENGRMIQRSFGGQKKKRTAYAKSSTGKVLMSALIDQARKYEAAGQITRLAHFEALDLLTEGSACRGVLLRDVYTGAFWEASGPVLLCTGGINGMLPGKTTGTTANTGDMTAAAFCRGAALGNLEFLQYHPTTAPIPGKRLMLSEAARGEGGRLFLLRDGKPWYFMEEIHPALGNLAPRDVISREMARLLKEGETAYLDLTGIPGEVWARRLPDLRREAIHYLGVDPAREPVAVSPGVHFFMGGLYVDEHHRTTLQSLWAAGECACQYHGANRLGGNSLLGAMFGGITAARDAAARAEECLLAPADGDPARWESAPERAARLGNILFRSLGVLREEATLREGLDALEAMARETLSDRETMRLRLGQAMVRSALARQESRGAHTRRDFPARDDERFCKTTVATLQNGEISIAFRDIPERRQHGTA